MNSMNIPSNYQLGRELLSQALLDLEKSATIVGLTEKYLTFQQLFNEALGQVNHTNASFTFYCQQERCLVIGYSNLQKIYPNFELSCRTIDEVQNPSCSVPTDQSRSAFTSDKLRDRMNENQEQYKKFHIIPFKNETNVWQAVIIQDIHNKLLMDDYIERIEKLFAAEKDQVAIRKFWEYKIRKTGDKALKFMHKILKKKVLSLEKKQIKLEIKEDFLTIPRNPY